MSEKEINDKKVEELENEKEVDEMEGKEDDGDGNEPETPGSKLFTALLAQGIVRVVGGWDGMNEVDRAKYERSASTLDIEVD